MISRRFMRNRELQHFLIDIYNINFYKNNFRKKSSIILKDACCLCCFVPHLFIHLSNIFNFFSVLVFFCGLQVRPIGQQSKCIQMVRLDRLCSRHTSYLAGHLVHFKISKNQLTVGLHTRGDSFQYILRHTKSLLGISLDIDCISIPCDFNTRGVA